MMVPIQVIRWYRMQCYDGTDSCATVVPIRRYCQIYPCKLKNLITNGEWKEVDSEKSFNEELKAILMSADISKLLTNLYSQMDD